MMRLQLTCVALICMLTGCTNDTPNTSDPGVSAGRDIDAGTDADSDTNVDSDTGVIRDSDTTAIADGYQFTAGDWAGYGESSIGEVDGGTVTPVTADFVSGKSSVCISGVLATNYSSLGTLSMTVDQRAADAAAFVWTPGGEYSGIYVDVGKTIDTNIRFVLEGNDGNSYCVDHVGAGGVTLRWSEFATECWGDAGVAYSPAIGFSMVRLYAPGDVDEAVAYDFCLNELYPQTTTIDSDTGGPTCDLPGSFSWTSTGPIITAKNSGDLSIKDPTIVQYDGKYHVFATVNNGQWHSVYFNFTDFDSAGAATQTSMDSWPTGGTVAPQVFYFEPQGLWYLIYQWPGRYSTNPDITNPNGWSAPKKLMPNGEPANTIDIWAICDDANCYLFFSNDYGDLFRAQTPIANFPVFGDAELIMHEDNAGDLFEASNVYKIKGQNKYLLMVECYGPRYFRSWTADRLDGSWTPLADTSANPLAGGANVVWPEGKWSDDISHGEMIRSGYNQKMEIDVCDMQFLYQGYDPDDVPPKTEYGALPYKLGLITRTNY